MGLSFMIGPEIYELNVSVIFINVVKIYRWDECLLLF